MAFDREMETHTLISMAADGFIKELGLKESDKYLLDGHIEFRDAEPGITLLRENCPDVYIIFHLISILLIDTTEHSIFIYTFRL